ncbi:hypothetical protein K402DRAFT_454274 [Aulographum hederae CBS 113979]|uniref:Uncharacterized protein n=1 Tax=Aulographum hederae CBS 113979 TaxID=1176131 RepID=A0A6G1H0S5_9PEZI|nr:hypothetical protein K402DRAFT_454274 [Aulographum hederae CBS 113979]
MARFLQRLAAISLVLSVALAGPVPVTYSHATVDELRSQGKSEHEILLHLATLHPTPSLTPGSLSLPEPQDLTTRDALPDPEPITSSPDTDPNVDASGMAPASKSKIIEFVHRFLATGEREAGALALEKQKRMGIGKRGVEGVGLEEVLDAYEGREMEVRRPVWRWGQNAWTGH